ncbi:tyrosine-type recombinase/integrase, partial [Micromonospora sp. NPDC047548]|uniref:tyrosine-type recombinase/integrase n=1 Tax=Micromonospora sp. NPDC047548 TaxID=3155624 RepID=UPI0033D1532A
GCPQLHRPAATGSAAKVSHLHSNHSASRRTHDLRHSYATWLVSDGVPINDVAKVMGHEQTSTTLDRYTHSTRDRDRRALASFAAFSLPQEERRSPEMNQDPSVEGS